MWIFEQIKKDMESIYPGSLEQLKDIENVPFDKAILLVAYLWTNCSINTNEFWYISCRKLLWEIPYNWIQDNIETIIKHVEINWSDDFEYANLCAAFFHVPSILSFLIQYGKDNALTNEIIEFAKDFETYLPNGLTECYDKTMERLLFTPTV